IIAALEERFPGIRERLCSGHGLRPGIAVAVNSQIATLGLMQPVPENSEVHFLPAVSGGGGDDKVTKRKRQPGWQLLLPHHLVTLSPCHLYWQNRPSGRYARFGGA